jgi:hypothetical protein
MIYHMMFVEYGWGQSYSHQKIQNFSCTESYTETLSFATNFRSAETATETKDFSIVFSAPVSCDET